MCLLFFAIDAHPRYRLVIAANRDESYDRPTAPADYWPDAPDILAGRDRKQGGTWLGVTREGRWAAVTSFRELPTTEVETSRGHLVSDYLTGNSSPRAYVQSVVGRGERYAGFNFVAGDAAGAVYGSNRVPALSKLEPGIYGLSNASLDTPWPKLARGKARLSELLNSRQVIAAEALFDILADRQLAPEAELPNTGVPLEWERVLSSAFITSPGHGYGTRSSTVVLVDQAYRVELFERSFLPSEDGSRDPGAFHEVRRCFR
jgi:uncharacterized protein with NRDE domain